MPTGLADGMPGRPGQYNPICARENAGQGYLRDATAAARRFGDVLLTLVPIVLGGVVTIEVCVLIGLPLNFADIVASLSSPAYFERLQVSPPQKMPPSTQPSMRRTSALLRIKWPV